MKRFFFWNRGSKGGPAGSGGDPGASALLTGDPGQDERFVQILLESIADVSSNMDLQTVLEGIADKSLQVTQAERVVVFLGSAADDLEIVLARDRDGEALSRDIQYSRSVVRKCVEEGQPVRSVVQSDREALELGQSVFDLKLRAVMCAPLFAKHHIVGAIYVDSRAARREFSGRDLALFAALSAQMAIAIDNARLYADSLEKVRLEKDVEIARRIQQHLLPSIPAGVPGLDVALRYTACDEASGDTYDFTLVDGGKLAVLIGDVTGHGVGAALLTHSAQAGLRSYLELVSDLSEVVTRLNNRLVEGVETGNFMSLVLALVDGRDGTLHYVNAGHPELLVVRADELLACEKTGMVLGVVGDAEYGVRGPIELRPGDLLFLRTDGVDESMNADRQPFGEERLEQLLRRCRDLSADEVLCRVEEALREHRGGARQDDDVTMIAIKVLES